MSDAGAIREVLLDLNRESRTGIAEAILCYSKSRDQLHTICDNVLQRDAPMVFTRLTSEQWQGLADEQRNQLDYDPVSCSALYRPVEQRYETAQVAVVTGGSSDVPVGREAARTLACYGHPVIEVNDVGVAGLWRIMDRLDDLKQMKVLICVAGMDAALPTVIGGVVSSVIIAVPTSVGYGAARGGETALSALLVSCASGLTVVNIDNGFGAACAALRVLNNLSE